VRPHHTAVCLVVLRDGIRQGKGEGTGQGETKEGRKKGVETTHTQRESGLKERTKGKQHSAYTEGKQHVAESTYGN